MSSKAVAGLALAALYVNQATVAHAGDPTSGPLITFNGFGTLGAVRSNETSGAFTLHALQKEGSRGDWSAKVDTRLGGQVSLRPSPQWSAVVQAVVEQRHEVDGDLRIVEIKGNSDECCFPLPSGANAPRSSCLAPADNRRQPMVSMLS